jgi:uncharacterized membrane protein
VHLPLSALALALWVASLFCDLLYLGGAEAAIWSPLALYTLVGGFVTALAAATPRVRNFGGIAHVPIDMIVLALYALNLWLRLNQSSNTAPAIALSMAGVGILAVSSWLGARAKVRAEGVKTVLFATGLAVSVSLIGWTEHVRAQLFSSKGPVIAIFNGELLVGEATGHLGGWGTIALHSPGKAEPACEGEFSYSEALGDAGQLRCSDGASAAFRFRRLTLMQGYGVGSPGGGALSFTYGLSVEDSAAYLDLPPGKELKRTGDTLELVSR